MEKIECQVTVFASNLEVQEAAGPENVAEMVAGN